MATTFDFRISCESKLTALADRTLEAAHRMVTQLEAELSEFKPESPVYQLNHAKPGERIVFTPSAYELLLKSMEVSRQTQRAFNPLAKSKDVAGLNWDPVTREVWRLSEGTWLGFGAIGKGYALDRVRTLVEDAGFENYILSGGGSSVVMAGLEGPQRPWQWGWSWKKNESGENLGLSLVHHEGKRIALGVSGTHEKGNHLISTDGPLRSALKSAVIATQSATEADALSTALFVSGWDQLKSGFKDLALPPGAAWIDETETPHWNGTFHNLWKNSLGSLLMFAAAFLGGLLSLSLTAQKALCDESIDLGAGDGANAFTPYLFDRSPIWVLLPIAFFLVVLLHLKKTKPKVENKGSLMNFTPKPNVKNTTTISTLLVASALYLSVETASAADIEPLNHAVVALLGTTKAFKKSVNDGQGDVPVFYSKDAKGKPEKIVFIEKGIYPPSCTHTWAVGFDARTNKLTDIRPIEMSCPHALPTKSASYLDQYKGKTPADAPKIDAAIHVIAKATGTCVILNDVVKRSLLSLAKAKE